MLEVKDLKAGYSRDVNILEDIGFTIGPGEVLGVIGLNGSGKSTLAKALVGRIPFRSGSITYGGISLMGVPESGLAGMGIAYMRQGGSVFGTLSVEENLTLAAGKRDIRSIYTPSFFPDKRKVRADRLSGGERHILALSMALASNPTLLILDEPCAGLSPSVSEAVYVLLEKMIRDRSLSVLLIDHNVARLVALSSRIALLSEGRLSLLPADMNTVKNSYSL